MPMQILVCFQFSERISAWSSSIYQNCMSVSNVDINLKTFLIYPWKAIMSASFPCRDKYISALLKSASKLIPQFFNICGSKVSEELRLEIPHSLFELVPDSQSVFYKGVCYVGPVLSARYGIYKYGKMVSPCKLVHFLSNHHQSCWQPGQA